MQALTFAQRLLQEVVLGLQFNDEVASVQVLFKFLHTQDDDNIMLGSE